MILHCDMDAFYASVDAIAKPHPMSTATTQAGIAFFDALGTAASSRHRQM
jgi:nucleotidyltransferase/DNA polymerase involved in DNA repair